MFRFPIPVAARIALVTLLFASAAHAQDVPERPTRFTLSIGPSGSWLDLPARTASELATAGVDLDSRRLGSSFEVGYAFTPRFELGLRLAGSGPRDGSKAIAHHFGEFQIEARTHLCPGRRIDPYVAGGFGGAALWFGDDANDDATLEADAVSFGSGVDLQWSRHFGMSFHYRYTLLDFAAQTVVVPGSQAGPIAVEGDAAVHHLGFSWDLRL